MEVTWIFWEEANPDMSVSITNSIFVKKELVCAFLKKKKTNPLQKCLITNTIETQKLWPGGINLKICVLYPAYIDTLCAPLFPWSFLLSQKMEFTLVAEMRKMVCFSCSFILRVEISALPFPCSSPLWHAAAQFLLGSLAFTTRSIKQDIGCPLFVQ